MNLAWLLWRRRERVCRSDNKEPIRRPRVVPALNPETGGCGERSLLAQTLLSTRRYPWEFLDVSMVERISTVLVHTVACLIRCWGSSRSDDSLPAAGSMGLLNLLIRCRTKPTDFPYALSAPLGDASHLGQEQSHVPEMLFGSFLD